MFDTASAYGQAPNPDYLPLTFIPNIIIEAVRSNSFGCLPYPIASNSVVLLADVCDFTTKTETYSKKGISGTVEITNILNRHISKLASIIILAGGDILQFAGDAFLCQWEDKSEKPNFASLVEQAYTCAIAIQTHKFFQANNNEALLKVKIGLALGNICTWVLGSPSELLLFATVGIPLKEVHDAEQMCTAGEIIVSHDVFHQLRIKHINTYESAILQDGFVKISGYDDNMHQKLYPDRLQNFERCDKQHISVARAFLLPAIRAVRTNEEINSLSEMRMVTILFVLLQPGKIDDSNLQHPLNVILTCIKSTGGVINKLLLFDKGCNLLIVFGLPGMKHANDAARAVLCTKDIISKLHQIDLIASAAIASGTCFCGIIGHPQRQEYTVIGWTVNLASRIMVAYKDIAPIVLDADTFHLSKDELGEANFSIMESRKLKGIDDAGTLYTYTDSSSRRRIVCNSEVIEESGIEKAGEEQERIYHCLSSMTKAEYRDSLHQKTLLPVVIVEGASGSGKSFLMDYAVKSSTGFNYQIIACCAIPSHAQEPFSTVACLIRRCLKLSDTIIEKQQAILTYVLKPNECHLFLLNHLFNVCFSAPLVVTVDKENRDHETSKLLKTIIQQFCKKSQILIAVDDANFMDKYSWLLIKELAETVQVLVFLSVPLNFNVPSFSASILLQKAFACLTLNITAGGYVNALVCWFLNVQGVDKEILSFVKRKANGSSELLVEILLSPSFTDATHLVPVSDILPAMLIKDIYMTHNKDQDADCMDSMMVCVLRPGVCLDHISTSANIEDAVEERLNDLNIQDRLILKRAAVLGQDFNQYTLKAVSPELSTVEVASSIANLISKHILTSACCSENILKETSGKKSSLTLKKECRCFCSKIYDEFTSYKEAINPHHQLKFRADVFRTFILFSIPDLRVMRLEVAEHLTVNGPFCASCNRKRTESQKTLNPKRTMCLCFEKIPRVFFLVALMHRAEGMMFLLANFCRKAAEAAININLPVQALNYIDYAEENLCNMWNVSTHQEESHFNLPVLKALVENTQAEAMLLLNNTYMAASQISKALEYLGLNIIDFYGIINHEEFRIILSRCTLLESQAIIKCIGVISKACFFANNCDLAMDFLKMEYIGLSTFPVSFLQRLNHMICFYKCNHKLKCTSIQLNLENSILKHCKEHLLISSEPTNMVEIKAIGVACVVMIQTNLEMQHLSRAELLAKEAVSILRRIKDSITTPHVNALLCETYYHLKKYSECSTVLESIHEVYDKNIDFTFFALRFCVTTKLLEAGIKLDVTEEYATLCQTFLNEWSEKSALFVQKDFAFYITVMLALWCLSEKSNFCNIPEKLLVYCYESAKEQRDNGGELTYWNIAASLAMLKLSATLVAKKVEFVNDTNIIHNLSSVS